MNLGILIAQDQVEMPSQSFWTSSQSAGPQILILAGVVLLVGLIFFMWAAFWRKPRRRRHSYHAPEEASLPRQHKHSSGFLGKRHRRHRRHHRDRPINPTLAQVGGLPPRRDPPSGP